MKSALLSGAAILALVSVTSAAVARDQVQVAGSSTVLPYAKIVQSVAAWQTRRRARQS